MKVLENLSQQSLLVLLDFINWHTLELNLLSAVKEVENDTDSFKELYNALNSNDSSNVIFEQNKLIKKNKPTGLYLKLNLTINDGENITYTLVKDSTESLQQVIVKCTDCCQEIQNDFYVTIEGVLVYSEYSYDENETLCLDCSLGRFSKYTGRGMTNIDYLNAKSFMKELTNNDLNFINELTLVPKIAVRDFKNTGYYGINTSSPEFNGVTPIYTNTDRGLSLANDSLVTPNLVLLNGVISICHTNYTKDTPVKIIKYSGKLTVVTLMTRSLYNEIKKHKEKGGKL